MKDRTGYETVLWNSFLYTSSVFLPAAPNLRDFHLCQRYFAFVYIIRVNVLLCCTIGKSDKQRGVLRHVYAAKYLLLYSILLPKCSDSPSYQLFRFIALYLAPIIPCFRQNVL